MNTNAVLKGRRQRFERRGSYDFFIFFPQLVSGYQWDREAGGHIADTLRSLTSEEIRSFVRNRIMMNENVEGLFTASENDYSPSSKTFVFDEAKPAEKIVVRHVRGDWTSSASMQELNVYFNNPLFGTTSTDLPHATYLCWVAGYHRNRIYKDDLVVPVARRDNGTYNHSRNDSVLPIQKVIGMTFPDTEDQTGLLLEDWVETRVERSDGQSEGEQWVQWTATPAEDRERLDSDPEEWRRLRRVANGADRIDLSIPSDTVNNAENHLGSDFYGYHQLFLKDGDDITKYRLQYRESGSKDPWQYVYFKNERGAWVSKDDVPRQIAGTSPEVALYRYGRCAEADNYEHELF